MREQHLQGFHPSLSRIRDNEDRLVFFYFVFVLRREKNTNSVGALSVESDAHAQHGGVHQKRERADGVAGQVLGGDEAAVVERRVELLLPRERGTHGPEAAAWREELHEEHTLEHLLPRLLLKFRTGEFAALGDVVGEHVHRARAPTGAGVAPLLVLTCVRASVDELPEPVEPKGALYIVKLGRVQELGVKGKSRHLLFCFREHTHNYFFPR